MPVEFDASSDDSIVDWLSKNCVDGLHGSPDPRTRGSAQLGEVTTHRFIQAIIHRQHGVIWIGFLCLRIDETQKMRRVIENLVLPIDRCDDSVQEKVDDDPRCIVYVFEEMPILGIGILQRHLVSGIDDFVGKYGFPAFGEQVKHGDLKPLGSWLDTDDRVVNKQAFPGYCVEQFVDKIRVSLLRREDFHPLCVVWPALVIMDASQCGNGVPARAIIVGELIIQCS